MSQTAVRADTAELELSDVQRRVGRLRSSLSSGRMSRFAARRWYASLSR